MAGGEGVGLTRAEVDECLDSSSSTAAMVDEEARRNKEVLGSGVPVYIIQGVHRVDGPEDVMVFLDIFAMVVESSV